MTMTKKDYQLIAQTIRGLTFLTYGERADVALDFAFSLATTNPLFDQDGFLQACAGMFSAPNEKQCLAYRGDHTGAWYVSNGIRFAYMGLNPETALSTAARVARRKGWIK
jgi:hypothetical protein